MGPNLVLHRLTPMPWPPRTSCRRIVGKPSTAWHLITQHPPADAEGEHTLRSLPPHSWFGILHFSLLLIFKLGKSDQSTQCNHLTTFGLFSSTIEYRPRQNLYLLFFHQSSKINNLKSYLTSFLFASYLVLSWNCTIQYPRDQCIITFIICFYFLGTNIK